MPLPTAMSDLSATAGLNYPSGSNTPSVLDEATRALSAIVKQNVSKGADIASASTLPIPASGGSFIVTGSVGISALSSTYSWDGREVVLKFAAALTITHNATSLILPGGANFTTAAGDTLRFIQESAGNWRCNGSALNSGGSVGGVPASGGTMTGPLTLVGDATASLHAVPKQQLDASTKQIQSVSASVSANALTLNYAGGNLDFRNATLGNGAPHAGVAVAANSIVVPSGATLGTINGTAARLVLLEAYNGGSPVLCVANIAGGLQLDETNLISPTTISGGSNSAGVIYSASAVSANSPYRIVGFVDITEAVAGTWATDATLEQGIGGQALAAMSSIGHGQTWQNVTPSRAIGVTYYNTTGKPIMVVAGPQSNAVANPFIQITQGGVSVSVIGSSQYNTNSPAVVAAIVPPGAAYLVNMAAGTVSLPANTWLELR